VSVLGIVAFNEVQEALELERIGLQSEVLVRPQIVDPELIRPGSFAGRLFIKEEHIGLHSLGVEDSGGQPEQSMDVAPLEELAADGLASSSFEEDVIGNNYRRPAIDLQKCPDVLEAARLILAEVFWTRPPEQGGMIRCHSKAKNAASKREERRRQKFCLSGQTCYGYRD